MSFLKCRLRKSLENWLHWLQSSTATKPICVCYGKFLLFLANLNLFLTWFLAGELLGFFKRGEIYQKMRRIKKKGLLLPYPEMFNIFYLAKSLKKIKGDMAEVGTYKGGSAEIIAQAKGKKALHLFDTFEGLPEKQTWESEFPTTKGMFGDVVLSEVKDRLKKYPNIFFYKGFFPKTGEAIKNKKFSFVHLDVDLYKSTLDCLEFFYSKMTPGGIILSHDYNDSKWKGVKKAFLEFFRDKPAPIIELPHARNSQCFVVKL